MLHTIVSLDDVFYDEKINVNNSVRSTNPFDYIRRGSYIDLPNIYGGYDCVSINSNISGSVSGNMQNTSYK